MVIEHKNQYIKIQDTLIRIAKIDTVKIRVSVKANNFGKVSDESISEIIISLGANKYVFSFGNESEQAEAFDKIERIITE